MPGRALLQDLPGGELVIAVADGAGSAARSQEGSALAASGIVAGLTAALAADYPRDDDAWEALIAAQFLAIHQELVRYAAAENASPREFATTLSCAVAVGDRLIVGQVGDGAIVAGAEDSSLFMATQPQQGEYANETAFLTSLSETNAAFVRSIPCCPSSLALTTDGLLGVALARQPRQEGAPRHYAPRDAFFRPLLTIAAEPAAGTDSSAGLAEFLASGRISALTDDDKTLVLAVRGGDESARASGG